MRKDILENYIFFLTLFIAISMFSPLNSAASDVDANNSPHITITKEIPANLYIMYPNTLVDKVIHSKAINAFKSYQRQKYILIRGWVI